MKQIVRLPNRLRWWFGHHWLLPASATPQYHSRMPTLNLSQYSGTFLLDTSTEISSWNTSKRAHWKLLRATKTLWIVSRQMCTNPRVALHRVFQRPPPKMCCHHVYWRWLVAEVWQVNRWRTTLWQDILIYYLKSTSFRMVCCTGQSLVPQYSVTEKAQLHTIWKTICSGWYGFIMIHKSFIEC